MHACRCAGAHTHRREREKRRNTDEDMGKSEPFYTTGGNINRFIMEVSM